MGLNEEIKRVLATPPPPSAEESLNDINQKVSTSAEQVTTNDLLQEQIDNSPLTNAELRASPVPVSGPLTDAELRANPVDVNFTGTIIADNNITEIAGNAVNVGIGNAGTGTQRVAVSSDSEINAKQSGTWNVNNVSGTVSLPTGASTSALQTDTIDSIDYLLYRNNGTFDAFYRQRFSTPETLFDSKQLADSQPIFWDDQQVSGSGTSSTYNTNQASTTISVGVAAGRRVRQTYRRFLYQPGKSQLWIETGVFGAAMTGIKRKAGYFDDKNGVFFDQQSDGMGVTVRTYTSGSVVDNRTIQADWNIDTMDGNGPSGINLNYTKTLIWFCDFEWLGVGTIRYGFFVGGRPYYCHEVNNSNINTVVYMSNPNLPLRYEIENTGAGVGTGFVHICSTVISEGGVKDTGYPFGVTRGSTPLTTLNDADIYPVFALRLKSDYTFANIKILSLSLTCTSTSAFNYYIMLNPTVTGTAFSFTGINDSSVEVDVSRTSASKVSGGRILFAGTDNQANTTSGVESVLNSDFYLGSSIAGVSDIVVIGVQRLTGTTETFYGSINWKDQQ